MFSAQWVVKQLLCQSVLDMEALPFQLPWNYKLWFNERLDPKSWTIHGGQVSVLTLCLEALWGAPLNRTCYNWLIKFGLWTAGFEKVYNRPWEWEEKCVSEEDAGHELCKQCSLQFSWHPINVTFSTIGLGSFHRSLPLLKTLLSSKPSSKQFTPWTDFQDYKFPLSPTVWCRFTEDKQTNNNNKKKKKQPQDVFLTMPPSENSIYKIWSMKNKKLQKRNSSVSCCFILQPS